MKYNEMIGKIAFLENKIEEQESQIYYLKRLLSTERDISDSYYNRYVELCYLMRLKDWVKKQFTLIKVKFTK